MRTSLVICRITCMLLVLSAESARSQFTFTEDQSIPVRDLNGRLLPNAWTGGLNAPQFSTMDFDLDGQEDLVLFDRMANIPMPFRNVAGEYRYAPEYNVLFPEDLTNWLLLRDFNCDGKKDIFTGDIFGAKVYLNVSSPETGLSWKPYMFYVPGAPKTNVILTKGFTRKNNLQMQYDDLPAIVDADGDGDMDIFSIRYGGYGMAEYHQNFSMERYGVCDSLDFERIDNWYGGFTQCKCEGFSFDYESCPPINGRVGDEVDDPAGRVQHAAGKAILTLDVDNDGDQDLIFSEAECNNLYLLANTGSTESPTINTVALYPSSQEVKIPTFPVAFWEDVDFDGVRDLIAAPNSYQKDFNFNTDYRESVWLYKNMGSNQQPDFQFIQKSFLQEDMVDVGDNAVPAFADADGDGDLDLFVGHSSGSTLVASLFYFENKGHEFQLVTEDYNNLSSLGLYNIKQQLVDVNGDQKIDLVFSGTSNTSHDTFIYYLLNKSDKGLSFSNQDLTKINTELSFSENYHLTHIDHDGKIDLLIGRFTGAIEYWRNIGTTAEPRYYQESPRYLNFSVSVARQSMAMYAADLNNDDKDDLIVSDQLGRLGIFNDFHEARDISAEITEIVLNPLTNEYHPTHLGRAWPTVATLFDSKRPAIIAGTIRGGLHVFKNEDRQLQFDELILSVYPNPITDGTTSIKTNQPTQMQVISSIGQELIGPRIINAGTTSIDLSALPAGMYILKFLFGKKAVHRKVIIQ